MVLLGLLLKYAPLILRIFGVAEKVEALIEEYEARKKKQIVADTPITKKELTDAADKGEL